MGLTEVSMSTILLAEDDQTLRNVVQRGLEKAGHTVLGVADGIEAVRVFIERQAEISLLIFDIGLPRMTGPDAYGRVREAQPDIPIIFITGRDAENKLLRAAVDDSRVTFLQKPLGMEALTSTVERMLALRR
jgi:two-component system cell cycle sensor histidine kinase/response regulator CckA